MVVEQFCVCQGTLEIRGKYYRPDGQNTYPTLLLGHEFALTMASTGRYARRLCPRGFNVVVFDFPGSGTGKSTGRSSTDMSVLTQAEDFGVLLDHVRSLPWVDRERIILGGCSQGGLAAALLAARREAEVWKLVLLYPGFNIPDDARKGSGKVKSMDLTVIPDEFTALPGLKLGKRYILDARSIEPWKEISTFSKPVLIVHGALDSVVPVRWSWEAAKRYPGCTLKELKWSNHAFFGPGDVRKAVQALEAFLK